MSRRKEKTNLILNQVHAPCSGISCTLCRSDSGILQQLKSTRHENFVSSARRIENFVLVCEIDLNGSRGTDSAPPHQYSMSSSPRRSSQRRYRGSDMSRGQAILKIPGLWSRDSGKGCAISVILREKTSWLNIATLLRRDWIVSPGLVSELVQLKVDVLVATSTLPIRAAKQATKTIPIVMASPTDPVAAGFVESLARPGGNITGVVRLPES